MISLTPFRILNKFAKYSQFKVNFPDLWVQEDLPGDGHRDLRSQDNVQKLQYNPGQESAEAAFGMIFQDHRTGSFCDRFQCQPRSAGDSEEGYWKDFYNNFMEKAKKVHNSKL